MSDKWSIDPKLVERQWKRISRVDAGSVVLWLCLGPIVLLPFRWILFGESLVTAILTALGQCIGLALVAAVIAAPLALPGWLFRKRYQMRPLFCASVLALSGAILSDSLLTPLAFFPLVGWFFMGLSLVVGFVSTSLFFGGLLLTTFPHRWGPLLVRASLCLGAAAAVGHYRKVFVPGREGYMATVFAETGPSIARLLAPKAQPPRQLPADFEAIGRQFNRTPASN